MPIWSEVLAEINATAAGGVTKNFDAVRRKYLLELHEHTGRDIVLYASAWLQKEARPDGVSVNDEDIHGLMEVTSGMHHPCLDLILHSPGGSPEAAEAIVGYLRSRFDHIRVIIPHLAMSAATMIACAADEIVMGKHSFVGPTDPQLLLSTPLGIRSVPAQALLDQFDRAQRESKDPTKLAAWAPMLTQFGPDLIEQSETALELSKSLVKTWLASYMFKMEDDGEHRADLVSEQLADHRYFKSHSRHLPRSELEKMGMRIVPLEEDPVLQDKSLSVFHAAMLTMSGTPALKIVESHQGRAFIKSVVLPAALSPIALDHPQSPPNAPTD